MTPRRVCASLGCVRCRWMPVGASRRAGRNRQSWRINDRTIAGFSMECFPSFSTSRHLGELAKVWLRACLPDALVSRDLSFPFRTGDDAIGVSRDPHVHTQPEVGTLSLSHSLVRGRNVGLEPGTSTLTEFWFGSESLPVLSSMDRWFLACLLLRVPLRFPSDRVRSRFHWNDSNGQRALSCSQKKFTSGRDVVFFPCQSPRVGAIPLFISNWSPASHILTSERCF